MTNNFGWVSSISTGLWGLVMTFFSEDTLKALTKRDALPEDIPPVQFISSGLYSLDYATGGGFPRQRVTEISGRNQSSKTTTCLICAGKVIAKGGYVAILETESALEFKWMAALGISRDEIYTGSNGGKLEDHHVHVWHPGYLESALETLITLYRSNKYDLIILDSFGGSPVRAAAESTMDDVIMMKKAKVGSAFKEKMMAVAYDGNAAVIITNQVYTNHSQPYYDKLKPEGGFVVSSGGESLPFLSAVRIYMETPGKVEDKGKNIIGRELRGFVHKNKTGRVTPQRFTFEINAQDPENPFINFAKDLALTAQTLGLLEKRGHYWFCNGENIAASDLELENLLLSNEKITSYLEGSIEEIIGKRNE